MRGRDQVTGFLYSPIKKKASISENAENLCATDNPRSGTTALFAVIAVAVFVDPGAGGCRATGNTAVVRRQLTRRSLAACAKTVATYSYGIYLTHVLALGLAFPNAGAVTLVQWGILVVLLPGLAALVYYTIEKPGILLGQQLARRLALKQPIRTGAQPW